jgi:S-adenosyl methyltransferase
MPGYELCSPKSGEPGRLCPRRPRGVARARIYDYVLRGTHNFAVDRTVAKAMRAQTPDLQDAA